MAAAILNQGKTAIRDSLKTLVTHVGLSTDATAFAATQTALNPSGSGTNIIKAATKTDVAFDTADATITVTSADGTGNFATVSVQNGSAASNALTRSVRASTIGIQAGDTYTVAVRFAVQDNS